MKNFDSIFFTEPCKGGVKAKLRNIADRGVLASYEQKNYVYPIKTDFGK
jgi:hypothetical protein